MRDGQTFLNGLRDEREVWYRGERVEDVVEHEVLGTAARHVAADFDLQLEAEHHDLAVTTDDEGRSYSTFWHVPRSSDDLARRSRLIEASTAHGATLVSLGRADGCEGNPLAAAEPAGGSRSLPARRRPPGGRNRRARREGAHVLLAIRG